MCKYSVAENIALNKAAYLAPYLNLKKDAHVVVDGRNEGKCFRMGCEIPVWIDLGEIHSIHHITTNFEDVAEKSFFGIYLVFVFLMFIDYLEI